MDKENSQLSSGESMRTRRGGIIVYALSGTAFCSSVLLWWLYTGSAIETAVLAVWITPLLVITALSAMGKIARKNGTVDLILIGSFLYLPVLFAWLKGAAVSQIILMAIAVTPMFLFTFMIVLLFGSFFS